jgi:beta-N-acetylhexosaminidase
LTLLAAVALLLAAQRPATPAKPRTAAAKPVSAAKAWLNQLTLEQQIAQLVIVNFYGEAPSADSKLFREYLRLVRDVGVGGMIVLNRVQGGLVVNAEPHAMAAFLNRMQRAATIPLLVGGDFERGASMRMTSTTKFPHNMAFAAAKDIDGTRFLARQTAREARAMGVHWVFAPAADVNNNADNPVIGLRSFSEDPDEAAAHVTAYIEGAKSEIASRVLTCVKHFPGHGDTNVDSHLGLGRVEGDRARLDAVELKPFRAAIAAKVDGVMTAHLAVPALEPREIPVTVSRAVMTDLLRKELGFTGLVTTDAMDMYALSKQFSAGEAAVRAIEAGVDVLLIPPSPERAIQGVAAAVRSGRISEARIRASVERVLAAKAALGLDKQRLVDIEKIADVIDSPEATTRAQQTADRALTLVRNEQSVFPVKSPDSSCLYLLVENRYSTLGRRLLDEVRQRAPRMSIRTLDAGMPEGAFTQTVEDAKSCRSVILASFASASAFRGDAALMLAPPLASFVDNLLKGPTPVGLISFGNPYLLKAYPVLPAYVATFSTAAVSEVAAAKALLGEIPFRGKLPVTIPGLAEYGTGLTQ